MSHQLQELINKIKADGIQEGQIKARHIEDEARQKAETIIKDANAQAQKILSDAKEEAQKMRTAAEVAVGQAGRNSVLAVRKEIEAMLKAVVLKEVRDALTPQQTVAILEAVIMQYSQNITVGPLVTLNPSDAQAVKDGLLAKLQGRLKKPVVFKTNPEISKGFTVSFDGGRSSFDFSDASLAEFLGGYLNDDLARILKTSVV